MNGIVDATAQSVRAVESGSDTSPGQPSAIIATAAIESRMSMLRVVFFDSFRTTTSSASNSGTVSSQST